MEENVLANTAPYWLKKKKNLHKYINKVFSASCEFLTSDIFHINVDSTAISAEMHFLQLVRLGKCKLIVKLLIMIC